MTTLQIFFLFTECQCGLRPKCSTDLAIYYLSQSMYDTIDKRANQITVFCDLTKAFDATSHNILLQKLSNYGIRGKALGFLKSYLSFRKQFTVYINESSSWKSITCGVPQGSILGLLLFLIYVNDIGNASDKKKYLLFADDTTIFIQGNNIQEMVMILNDELKKIFNWIKSNKLTLNTSKTFYMVSSSVNENFENINISINELKLTT